MIDVLTGCGDLSDGYVDSMGTQTHVEHALRVNGNHDRPQALLNGRGTDHALRWGYVDRRTVYPEKLDLV